AFLWRASTATTGDRSSQPFGKARRQDANAVGRGAMISNPADRSPKGPTGRASDPAEPPSWSEPRPRPANPVASGKDGGKGTIIAPLCALTEPRKPMVEPKHPGHRDSPFGRSNERFCLSSSSG